MKTLSLALLVVALFLVPASADQVTPQAAVERLFTSSTINADWFAPSFLAQVPVTQVQVIVGQLKSQLGAYKGVRADGDNFLVDFDKGSVPTIITLDGVGRIAGLLFKPPVTANGAPINEDASKAAIARLFTSAKLDPTWFEPTFLAQVPATKLQSIVDELKSQLGAFHGVRVVGSDFYADFDKGSVPTAISLDAGGRIQGLFFRPTVLKRADIGAVVDQFKALPGKVSVLVVDGSPEHVAVETGSTVAAGSQERVAVNAGMPLAVGSAFKLAVLSATKKQVDAQRHSWSETVIVRARYKSLPSGTFQYLPNNSKVTLLAAATAMISKSDNTAADLVFWQMGRSAVTAESPRNQPFLTTREAFVLKNPANADLLAAWRHGDKFARRGVLGKADARPLPSVAIFGHNAQTPVALDIEWFFTARELCSLMREDASLPLTSINPGVADPTAWKSVSYKGGSEPGVINMTTWLVGKDGKTHCVSATWNNTAALDESRFEFLYGQLLASL